MLIRGLTNGDDWVDFALGIRLGIRMVDDRRDSSVFSARV